VQTGVFGIALWLKCALAGTVVGATVAGAQVFSGRWHPAWARRLAYWFSCPIFAGLATGVIIALRGVPPLSDARAFWLVLCLVIGAFTALVGAATVAFLSRNYDPDVIDKSKRATRRSSRETVSNAEKWEEKLRLLFRPPPTAESASAQSDENAGGPSRVREVSTIPGQKAKLPPERYPVGEVKVRVPHFPGKPPRTLRPGSGGQGKLEKPIK